MTMKTKRWRKPWTTLLVQGTEQSARKVEQTENKNDGEHRITQALGQRKHLNAESVFTVIWASTRHVYPFDCSEKEAETHLCPQPWRCNELVNKQPLYGREQLQPMMTLDQTFKERQMMSADSTGGLWNIKTPARRAGTHRVSGFSWSHSTMKQC